VVSWLELRVLIENELSLFFDPLSWFLALGSWFFVLPSIPVFLNQL